jgi:hypothetical protein
VSRATAIKPQPTSHTISDYLRRASRSTVILFKPFLAALDT